MKFLSKLLILPIIASSLLHATEIHGVTFTVSSSGAMQNQSGRETFNFLGNPGAGLYGQVAGVTIGGLCLLDGAGFRNNNGNSGAVTLSYLYVGSNIQFVEAGLDGGPGYISNNANNGNNLYFTISANSGAWVDINIDASNHISTSNMNTGTLYLGTGGHVASTFDSTNTVVATAVKYVKDVPAGLTYYSSSQICDSSLYIVERTLMTGDFTGWTGTVEIEGATLSTTLADNITNNMVTQDDYGTYFITADATGLKMTYIVPEPATATLSLIALAGLAARRRRKA